MDEKYNPVYLLRLYIWNLLKNNTDMKESDYGGKVPVIPVADNPKLSDLGKPYLVYGYAFNPTLTDRGYRERGSMSMIVYSPDFAEIGKILNILRVKFNKEDETAKEINAFTSQIPEFIGVRFLTIETGFIEGPSPETSEGGKQSALININFECCTDYDTKRFRPSGTSYWDSLTKSIKYSTVDEWI